MFRDFKYALRMLAASPTISTISIVALALGIGVSATMFSIVYGAMMRGLPFEDGDRMYAVSRFDIENGNTPGVPIHDYLDWQAQQTSFERLSGFYSGTVNVRGSEAPERYDGAFVTASFFDVVGVRPILGRAVLDGEDSPAAEPVIVIGNRLWRERFGGDPGVIGQTVVANGEQATIVGVMPEGFDFPELQDLWVPLRLDPVALPRGDGTGLQVLGVLRDDVTLDEATAEFTGMAAQIAAEYSDVSENMSVRLRPFTDEAIGDEGRTLLYTSLGAVFFVLLIACANVANLLLSRAFDRNKEVAIRTALGAGRGRVIAQILIEAGVLALVGGVIGIARLGVAWFNGAIANANPPSYIDIRVDGPILLFVLGVTSLATLLAGTLPALQVTRGNLNEVLADESRGASGFKLGRLSRALVVFQVALSCGLLVGAGLMIKSVVNLGSNDYGFEPAAVFTARLGLFPTDYPELEDRRRFFEDLHRRLEERPEVVAAALTPSLPVNFAPMGRVSIEGESYAEPVDQPLATRVAVTPGLFATLDVELLAGRDFDVNDIATGEPVAIVNRSFANELFGSADPIGRRISWGTVRTEGADRWMTIVGVAPDLYVNGPLNERPAGFYVPLAQDDARFVSIALRTRGDPFLFAPQLRAEVQAVDPNLPLYWVRPMTEVIQEQTWTFWILGTLFTAFGSVALLLASVGLYGVMSFAVRRRTREMGIRVALGSDARGVLGLILRQGMFQLLIGLALGMLLARALAGLLQAGLFQVEPTDPATFASIALALLATGIVACVVPALRAARVDPMIALRNQ